MTIVPNHAMLCAGPGPHYALGGGRSEFGPGSDAPADAPPCPTCGGKGWYIDRSVNDRAVKRAADALDAEVKKRNEWYGLDNWSFEEVAEFVLRAAGKWL